MPDRRTGDAAVPRRKAAARANGMDEARVVILTRDNIGRVERWRVDRQGTLNFLHAFLNADWFQVVITRSDPACIPPRALRLRPGEFTWTPRRSPP